jgi:hypothetical protein
MRTNQLDRADSRVAVSVEAAVVAAESTWPAVVLIALDLNSHPAPVGA